MAWEVGKPGRNEEHKIMCYYAAIGILLYLRFDSIVKDFTKWLYLCMMACMHASCV